MILCQAPVKCAIPSRALARVELAKASASTKVGAAALEKGRFESTGMIKYPGYDGVRCQLKRKVGEGKELGLRRVER